MIQLMLAGVAFWLFECRRELLALIFLEVLMRWSAYYIRTGCGVAAVPLFLVFFGVAAWLVVRLVKRFTGKEK